MQERTDRHPDRKALFLAQADGGFSALLGATLLAAEGMEHGSKHQGKSQAKRVCHPLSQRQCLVAPCQPLVRIPQKPQCPGGNAVAHHTSVVPIKERRSTVSLRIVE